MIGLEQFRVAVNESAIETKEEYPDLYFDYAGIIPENDQLFRYDSTPINTKIFAMTGGDGVHYSILELSEDIQPIIMTIPMALGDSPQEYNWILGENITEFLSIGYYNGWFLIEQIHYDNKWAIDFYKDENQDDDYQLDGQVQFVKKMRNKLKYNHIPLSNNRLNELEHLYFKELQFKPEFIKVLNKRN